jgi:hypothetical protein
VSVTDVADKQERGRRHDARRRAIAPWRNWYKLARWFALRLAQLTKQPLCERCLAQGKVTAATVAHHKREHKGDPILFWDPANLASSCKRHHDSDEQQIERIGYSTAVGVDGWPVDPNHPCNRDASATPGGERLSFSRSPVGTGDSYHKSKTA